MTLLIPGYCLPQTLRERAHLAVTEKQEMMEELAEVQVSCPNQGGSESSNLEFSARNALRNE